MRRSLVRGPDVVETWSCCRVTAQTRFWRIFPPPASLRSIPPPEFLPVHPCGVTRILNPRTGCGKTPIPAPDPAKSPSFSPLPNSPPVAVAAAGARVGGMRGTPGPRRGGSARLFAGGRRNDGCFSPRPCPFRPRPCPHQEPSRPPGQGPPGALRTAPPPRSANAADPAASAR